jgi:hypothetical protein
LSLLTLFISFLNSKLLASALAVISINGFLIFVNEMLQAKIKIFKKEKLSTNICNVNNEEKV